MGGDGGVVSLKGVSRAAPHAECVALAFNCGEEGEEGGQSSSCVFRESPPPP